MSLLAALGLSASLIILSEARQNGINQEKDPFISLINESHTEILMASYKLQEKKLPQQDMLDALERAVKRGVKVHLIAENRLTEMELISTDGVREGDSLKAYKDRGVQVYHIPKEVKSVSKFIVVDGKDAIVGTTNFDKEPDGQHQSTHSSRDFAVKLINPEIVKELRENFWKDLKGIDFEEREVVNLLWGPKKLRENLNQLIESAENSIKIYQQDFTDTQIVEALCHAARRGVKVELVMSPHPFGFNKPDNNKETQQKLRDAGGAVFLNNTLHIHAKVMIVDDKLMYLGSLNFYKPAIDSDRTLGLLIPDENLINSVLQVFEEDKRQASAL